MPLDLHRCTAQRALVYYPAFRGAAPFGGLHPLGWAALPPPRPALIDKVMAELQLLSSNS